MSRDIQGNISELMDSYRNMMGFNSVMLHTLNKI